MIRLLVVEDSALMRKLLTAIFEAEGDFAVETARNGIEALAMIARQKPDVVTLDIHMPEMDGLACLNRIMIEYPCPVVMVSSLTDTGAEETFAALELGAVDFIAKPDGAISLSIDDLSPRLVEKVRTAARVKLRSSHRLSERLRRSVAPIALSERPRSGLAEKIADAPSRPLSSPRRAAAFGLATGLVLIGTSTGGPPALDRVLSPLPADFAWPIVVAQHMPASFTKALARRLDGICALNVVEVAGQATLEPGTIYIARGDADILISTRAGQLVALSCPIDPEHLWHPSVERLVSSALRRVPAEKLLGVLMTGMGNDGAKSMAELKASGGRTIAEAEETAVVWGMPGELVRLGGASECLPLEKISSRLLELIA